MTAALELNRIDRFTRQIDQEAQRLANAGTDPVVLCSPSIRLALRRMLERQLPGVPVLAYTEVPPGVDVAVDAVVGFE